MQIQISWLLQNLHCLHKEGLSYLAREGVSRVFILLPLDSADIGHSYLATINELREFVIFKDFTIVRKTNHRKKIKFYAL